jgi:hypothetical protein
MAAVFGRQGCGWRGCWLGGLAVVEGALQKTLKTVAGRQWMRTRVLGVCSACINFKVMYSSQRAL